MQTYIEFLKAAAGKKDVSAGDKALYAGAMGAGALAGLPQYRKIVFDGWPLPILPQDKRLRDFFDNDAVRRRLAKINSPKFARLKSMDGFGAVSIGAKRLGAGLGLSLAGAYAGKKAVDFLRSKKYKD